MIPAAWVQQALQSGKLLFISKLQKKKQKKKRYHTGESVSSSGRVVFSVRFHFVSEELEGFSVGGVRIFGRGILGIHSW